MVSDLSEFHHIDLVSALRDYTHSPRTIIALLSCLPDTSALHASLRGEPRGWGSDRHLLATLVDALQVNTWVTASANSRRRPSKPRPIKRPTKQSQTRVISVAQFSGRRG